jgi:hypothetical protein
LIGRTPTSKGKAGIPSKQELIFVSFYLLCPSFPFAGEVEKINLLRFRTRKLDKWSPILPPFCINILIKNEGKIYARSGTYLNY